MCRRLLLFAFATLALLLCANAQNVLTCPPSSTPGVDTLLLSACESLSRAIASELLTTDHATAVATINYPPTTVAVTTFTPAPSSTAAIPSATTSAIVLSTSPGIVVLSSSASGSTSARSSSIASSFSPGAGAGNSASSASSSASPPVSSTPSETTSRQTTRNTGAGAVGTTSASTAGTGSSSQNTLVTSSTSSTATTTGLAASETTGAGLTQGSANGDNHHYRNTVVIPAAVVCSVVGAALIALILFFLIRRRRRRDDEYAAGAYSPDEKDFTPAPSSEMAFSGVSDNHVSSAPPVLPAVGGIASGWGTGSTTTRNPSIDRTAAAAPAVKPSNPGTSGAAVMGAGALAGAGAGVAATAPRNSAIKGREHDNAFAASPNRGLQAQRDAITPSGINTAGMPVAGAATVEDPFTTPTASAKSPARDLPQQEEEVIPPYKMSSADSASAAAAAGAAWRARSPSSTRSPPRSPTPASPRFGGSSSAYDLPEEPVNESPQRLSGYYPGERNSSNFNFGFEPTSQSPNRHSIPRKPVGGAGGGSGSGGRFELP